MPYCISNVGTTVKTQTMLIRSIVEKENDKNKQSMISELYSSGNLQYSTDITGKIKTC